MSMLQRQPSLLFVEYHSIVNQGLSKGSDRDGFKRFPDHYLLMVQDIWKHDLQTKNCGIKSQIALFY